MKYFLIISMIIGIKNAQSLPEDIWVETNYKYSACNYDVPQKPKNWVDYPHKFCNGKCPDGSFSVKQASSEGAFEQEGMCGQTSIINIIEMACGITVSNELANEYLRDVTPGVSPSTFSYGLNELSSIIESENPGSCDLDKFKKYNSSSFADFPTDLYLLLAQGNGKNMITRKNKNGAIVQRSPVAIFIQNPNRGYFGAHWVTVVDIEDFKNDCTAIVNHWGKQFKVPCDDLAEMAKKGAQYPSVGAYTIISEG
jgi:hypothetical protein